MSRIILVGKGASGKSHYAKKMADKGYRINVSYTTRPPRTGELEGVDYHFVSEDYFLSLQNGGFFYETVKRKNWWYGTGNSRWEWEDLFIMTPSGIASIKPEDRKDCFIIYLDIPFEVRRERLMQRDDADSVERRLASDEEDFADFTDFDVRFTNPDF